MSQQQSFLTQARPTDLKQPILRAPNDDRYRGHQEGQTRYINGIASQSGAGVPVPRGPTNGHGKMGSLSGQGFAGARSPPSAKNTSHVPCKFYKQGACQAGSTCPYSHAENIGPCKYFQKGNCKFGMRCANEHILPDGARVHKQSHIDMGPSMGHMNHDMPKSQAQRYPMLSLQQNPYPQSSQPYDPSDWDMPIQAMIYGNPTIETTHVLPPEDSVGSPPQDHYMGRSPPGSRLSVLEAQLPASFDSQGISHIARYGPQAASVPARTSGFEQPAALRSLHSSAFGESGKTLPQRIGMRSMHSATFSRQKLLSSSVGNGSASFGGGLYGVDDDDIDLSDVTFEDALPGSLGELLTPQERLRRLSRTAEDESVSNYRSALSAFGTSLAESPKFGSPGALGSSPSRYGPLFQRQQRERSEATLNETVTNAFGHVGSPLRSSLLNSVASPPLRASNGRPISGDFSISSPPRHASGSLISQQFQRNRLSARAESSESASNISTLQHPGVQRLASGSAPTPPHRLDRTTSTTSSTTGIGREKIDEEDDLFAMEGLNIGADRSKRSNAGPATWADALRSDVSKSGVTNGHGGRRDISGS